MLRKRVRYAYGSSASAIALFHDCVVVTSNTKHFEKIEDLKIEDWNNDF
ncbi:MAG: hypothetical protein ACRC2S_18350 [Waterburya sp.]